MGKVTLEKAVDPYFKRLQSAKANMTDCRTLQLNLKLCLIFRIRLS